MRTTALLLAMGIGALRAAEPMEIPPAVPPVGLGDAATAAIRAEARGMITSGMHRAPAPMHGSVLALKEHAISETEKALGQRTRALSRARERLGRELAATPEARRARIIPAPHTNITATATNAPAPPNP